MCRIVHPTKLDAAIYELSSSIESLKRLSTQDDLELCKALVDRDLGPLTWALDILLAMKAEK